MKLHPFVCYSVYVVSGYIKPEKQIVFRVCEEISVNNQIFYDNELAEGLF